MKKITSAVWGPCDEYVVTGHEDGTIAHWDPKVSMCGCCEGLGCFTE
jgi:WD40 repeat protein